MRRKPDGGLGDLLDEPESRDGVQSSKSLPLTLIHDFVGHASVDDPG